MTSLEDRRCSRSHSEVHRLFGVTEDLDIKKDQNLANHWQDKRGATAAS
jgi:hypothetical protein